MGKCMSENLWWDCQVWRTTKLFWPPEKGLSGARSVSTVWGMELWNYLGPEKSALYLAKIDKLPRATNTIWYTGQENKRFVAGRGESYEWHGEQIQKDVFGFVRCLAARTVLGVGISKVEIPGRMSCDLEIWLKTYNFWSQDLRHQNWFCPNEAHTYRWNRIPLIHHFQEWVEVRIRFVTVLKMLN